MENLLTLLEEAGGAPLTTDIGKALQSWEQAGAKLTLSRPALLECDDPLLLGKLARKRRFRQRIVRTLSPRAVIVDDTHLEAALRHLRREGRNPRVLLAKERGQTLCLVACCHQAHDERVFRLDRIQEMQVVDRLWLDEGGLI